MLGHVAKEGGNGHPYSRPQVPAGGPAGDPASSKPGTQPHDSETINSESTLPPQRLSMEPPGVPERQVRGAGQHMAACPSGFVGWACPSRVAHSHCVSGQGPLCLSKVSAPGGPKHSGCTTPLSEQMDHPDWETGVSPERALPLLRRQHPGPAPTQEGHRRRDDCWPENAWPRLRQPPQSLDKAGGHGDSARWPGLLISLHLST